MFLHPRNVTGLDARIVRTLLKKSIYQNSMLLILYYTNRASTYAICACCKVQYVGQTSQQVIKPMTSRRFDIQTLKDPTFSTHVVAHINYQHQHRSTNYFTFNT